MESSEMSALVVSIDRSEAIERATRFLEQHHSIITVEARMTGDCWLVLVQVGFMPAQVKQVRIDAKSGKIMGCA